MEYLESLGIRARKAAESLSRLDPASKNLGLRAAAESLKKNSKSIIAANDIDIARAKAKGISDALSDRLRLTEERIAGMAEGIIQVSEL